MSDPKDPRPPVGSGGGFYNTHPYWANKRRNAWLYRWNRDLAPQSISQDLAALGWQPISTVPKNRYVALYFRGGTAGDFEGSCAYILENDQWHIAQSMMVFHADTAVGWKRWTRQSLEAEPLPPKGRKG